MGNLLSVQLAFSRLNQSLKIVRQSSDLSYVDSLVLPGVGAFDPAMEQLTKTGLVPDLKTWVKEDKPLLGICLGLQLFFESSEEGQLEGLGFLKGKVQRLPNNEGERVPHMGWAPLMEHKKCPLLRQQIQNNWMYFVHSYSAVPKEIQDLAATTQFGTTSVTAMVWKGRLGACQFHPEKSAEHGKRMLQNWLEWLNDGAVPTP